MVHVRIGLLCLLAILSACPFALGQEQNQQMFHTNCRWGLDHPITTKPLTNFSGDLFQRNAWVQEHPPEPF